MTTYRCPQGHPLDGAWKFDMWCGDCGHDVIGVAVRADHPPDYAPSDDELTATWAGAMAVPHD